MLYAPGTPCLRLARRAVEWASATTSAARRPTGITPTQCCTGITAAAPHPTPPATLQADRLSSQAGLAKWIKLSSHLDSSFQLAGDSEPAGTQSAGHNPAAGTPTMGGTPRTTGGTPSAGGTPTTGSTPSAGGIPTTGGTPVSLQAPVPPPALESPVAPVGRQLAAAFQSAASPSGSPPAADGAAAGQPIPSEDRTHDSLPGRDGSSAAVNDNNSNNDDRQQPPANGRHGQPSADSSSNKAPTRTASRHAAGSRRAAAPAAPLLALLAVLLVVGTAGAAVALARHGVRIPIPSTIVPTQWAALDWQQHAAAAHCALRTAAGSARQRLVQQAASWQQAGQEQWVRVSAQAQAQWRSWQAAGLSGAKAGLAGAAYEASQAASEGLLALRASAAPAAAAARQRWRQLRATASWQQAAGALRRLSTAVARSHWGSRIWTVLSQAAKRLPIPAVPSSWLSMTWPQAATSSAASWLQQAASQGLLALRAGAAPTAAEVQKRWAELASSAAMGFQQATATLSEATPPAVSQALVALRANAAPGAAALQRRWRLVCLQLPPALRALLAPGAGPLAIMPAAEQAAVSAEAPPSTSPEQPTTPPALDASTVDTAPPLAATADAAPSPAPALLRGVHAAVLASPLLQGLHAALLASPLRTVGAATAAAACLSVALVLAVSWGRVAAARRALLDPAWQPFPTPTPVPGDRCAAPLLRPLVCLPLRSCPLRTSLFPRLAPVCSPVESQADTGLSLSARQSADWFARAGTL